MFGGFFMDHRAPGADRGEECFELGFGEMFELIGALAEAGESGERVDLDEAEMEGAAERGLDRAAGDVDGGRLPGAGAERLLELGDVRDAAHVTDMKILAEQVDEPAEIPEVETPC